MWIFGNLGTNVANGSIRILTFGYLGTNVANGSIRIWTFGYQCCKWIDPNMDIWVINSQYLVKIHQYLVNIWTKTGDKTLSPVFQENCTPVLLALYPSPIPLALLAIPLALYP